MSHELPSVAGRRLSTSIADLENRCLVHLAEEQEKLMPDNALIAVLCDAVRLGREYADEMTGKVAESIPVTDGVWEAKAIPWDKVIEAIAAVQKASSKSGSMYPQVAEEHRDDEAATRRVIRGLTFYAKSCESLDGWPALSLRAAPPLPESPWRPMESAPRDGTPFLAWIEYRYNSVPTRGVYIIAVDPDEHDEALDPDYEEGWDFEHYSGWMPLPAAPDSPKGGEDAR